MTKRRVCKSSNHLRLESRVDHVKLKKEVRAMSKINVIIRYSDFFKARNIPSS